MFLICKKRPGSKDRLGVGTLAHLVTSVHVAVDPIELGRLLELDIEPWHLAKQRAQADRVGGVAIEAEEIDEVRFQPLQVGTDGRNKAEHQLGADVAQQVVGLVEHGSAKATCGV